MRRHLLLLILAGAALAARGATEITPGVHLIPGKFVPGSQPDGNTVIFTTPSGLIVIDTGRYAAHTQSIVDFAKEAKKPVQAIVNTHWHLDHITGNLMLRREYPEVKVYGSSALGEARKGFLANYRKQLEEMIKQTVDVEAQKPFRTEMATIDAGDRLMPDVVVVRSGKQTIAGRKLNLELVERAVTAGDVWVFDPKTRVLVSGDLITLPVPLLDTACPTGWKKSLDRLAKADFKVLIPGHGAPMTRKDFETYRTAFNNLLACTGSKEDCINGWITDASQLIPEKEQRFTRMLMDYYVDVLRGDPARIAARCGQ